MIKACLALVLAASNAFAGPVLDQLEKLAPAGSSPIPAARAADPLDETADYSALWKTMNRDWTPAELSEIRRCKVILVVGFMANGIFKRWEADSFGRPSFHPDDPIDFDADRAADERQFNDDYVDLMKWLDKNGVEYQKVQTNTRHTSEHNAPAIAAALAASDKPVIFITHSKGGLDVLKVLLDDPAAAAKTRGWIAIQAPFQGSPVADFWVDNAFFFHWASKYLVYMGGHPDVLINMTTASSKAYYESHRAAIETLAKRLPMITVGTCKDPEGLYDTSLKIWRDMMWFQGLHNDGMVPKSNAFWPSLRHVLLADVDHNMTTSEARRPFDRVRFSKTLLALLFKP